MANKTWVGTDSGNEGDYSVADNWAEGAIPGTGDDVRIPAGSYAITAGLNQSAVAIGDFIIEQGYDQNIGTSTAFLRIDPNRFEVTCSGGTQYIDIGSAAIDVQVNDTGSAAEGYAGLNLLGSAIANCDINGGYVGIANLAFDTSTVTTLRVIGSASRVILGAGASVTTISQIVGEVIAACGATTINLFGGTLNTKEDGAITTVNLRGGEAILSSSGTITTLNLNAGVADFMQSSLPRTVSTLNLVADEGSVELRYDSYLTISTFNEPAIPILLEATRV